MLVPLVKFSCILSRKFSITQVKAEFEKKKKNYFIGLNRVMQGPARLWEKMLLSLGVAGGEPGIEGEEIAPLAKENVATP